MPTVKLPNGTSRVFPYNAVGKAQADSFSKMMKGKKEKQPWIWDGEKNERILMAKGRTKKKGNKICPAGIAWAKRTFDTYPSAYANMAASKYCKDPNYAKKSKR